MEIDRQIAGWILAASLLSVLPEEMAMAQSEDEIRARNEATVEAAFEAWQNGTGTPYDLLADDVVWTIVGDSLVSRAYASREEFLSKVIRPFGARMSSGLVPTIRDIYSDGDTVIVFFDAAGKARDGKPYRNTYAWFLELEDDQIVKATAFFDSIAFNDLWQRVKP